MASLLDIFGTTPEQTQAIGLLGAGLMAGNPAAAFANASGFLSGADDRKLRRGLLEAQLADTMAQTDERKMIAAQRQAEAERQARIRSELPGLFRAPGMAGGEAVPQTFGATDVPMFSKPVGVAQMRPADGGFDVQRAIALGLDPKTIEAYAGLQNIGRPKATRQMEVDDGSGGKRIALVDDFGRKVAEFSGYTAPVQVGQGDRVSFVKPAPGVSLPINMSPSERDASARGWANNALTRRGQDMTDARAREANTAGKVPAGYRLAANGQGLEYIPGGPADPNAAKKAAPTEFQGKAAMFGDRAAEANNIISSLEGKYSPAMLNAKTALGSVWGVGGGLEAAGNVMLPANAQKVEQAQRDFVNAVLRLESGAAIGKDEFDNAKKQYFPQPGDSAAVITQKRANRERAINGLKANARTSGATQNADPSQPAGDDNDPLGLRR